jgi:hypothetical protein
MSDNAAKVVAKSLVKEAEELFQKVAYCPRLVY